MGIFDHIKSGTKNVLNKTDEELGSMKIKGDISKVEEENNRRYAELGKKVYRNFIEPYEGFDDEMETACKAIKSNLDKIADLEKSLEEHRQTHKDERQSNRDAADASDRKDEEAKAEEPVADSKSE